MTFTAPFSPVFYPVFGLVKEAGGPLVYDTFTDTNGTNLTAHTPDIDVVGGGWAANAGTFVINNNQAQVNTSGRYVIDAGQANVLISDDLSDSGNSGTYVAYIVGRLSDSTHYWRCAVSDNPAEIQIIEVNGGSTQRASAAAAVVTDVLYSATLSLSGNDIVFSIASLTASCNYSSSFNNDKTKHGIGGHNVGNKCQHDNFLVEAL